MQNILSTNSVSNDIIPDSTEAQPGGDEQHNRAGV